MGQEEWECSRVLAGRPVPGRELGLPGSPTALEAGLYHAVDLRKVRSRDSLYFLFSQHRFIHMPLIHDNASAHCCLKVIGHPGLKVLAEAEASGQSRQLWGLDLQVRLLFVQIRIRS